MIREAIKKIKNRADLSGDEMAKVFSEIMDGIAEKNDVKEFLLSLRAKGESLDEIVASAEVMRQKSLKVSTSIRDLVDTCGTGGAARHDVNISTIVAILLSACGIKVAKHGNRSYSGRCGSADFLEGLGINIKMDPEMAARSLENAGFVFIFAQKYHPAMKNVVQARKELATKTIFNILGPLSNPAGATMQTVGVYAPDMTEIMAAALKRLGAKKAFVVHGLEGFDEISIKGKTKVSELRDGHIETFEIAPSDFGIEEGDISEVLGGDRNHNVSVGLDVFNGKRNAVRDMVLINAAAALKMVGRVGTLTDGIKEAVECIDSGRALKKVQQLRKA